MVRRIVCSDIVENEKKVTRLVNHSRVEAIRWERSLLMTKITSGELSITFRVMELVVRTTAGKKNPASQPASTLGHWMAGWCVQKQPISALFPFVAVLLFLTPPCGTQTTIPSGRTLFTPPIRSHLECNQQERCWPPTPVIAVARSSVPSHHSLLHRRHSRSPLQLPLKFTLTLCAWDNTSFPPGDEG